MKSDFLHNDSRPILKRKSQGGSGPPTLRSTTDGSTLDFKAVSDVTDEPLEKSETESLSLTTASGKTETKSDDEDPQTLGDSTSHPGPDVNVLGSVGIVAFAATVITVLVIRAIKGMRNRDCQPELRVAAVPDTDREGEGRQDTGDYHLYSEVQDEQMYPCSAAPVFPCRAPRELPEAPGESADGYLIPVPHRAEPVSEPATAVVDAYLNPVASRAVKEGTDGAQNVIPLYGNSGSADGNTI
ncbi:hypothetical protein BaRGS_00035343 [Batillaria attramentaria]|uniref:Uncharacterized protein n=1 Tax=Batillaria attramentaria TaxID=370345 RepID=A0ABD0JFN7_9CAEN